MNDTRPSIMGLTIHRPWSELIADGKKTVENRDWPPMQWMLGRYIAVHASTRWDQEGADFINRNQHRLRSESPRLEACKTGIIAVAKLVGWVEETYPTGFHIVQLLPEYKFTDTDFRWLFGKFGWLLRDVRRIAPVEIKGKQKLWALDKPVYETVRRRYAKLA